MSVVGLSMEGAQGVAAAMNALSQSVEQLAARQAANTRATVAGARASTQAASGLQSLAQQAQQGVQRVQGVASAVQSLVSQLGSDNRTAGLISSVAGATAQFASMGAMLGPGGAVVGGVLGMAAGLRAVVTAANAAAEAVTRLNSASASVASRLGSALADPSTMTEEQITALMTEGAESRRTLLEREAELLETVNSVWGDDIERMNASVEAGRVRDQITVLTERIEALNALDPSALAREAPTSTGRVGIDVGTGGAGPGGEAIGRPTRGGGGRRPAPEADPFDENAFLDSTGAMAEAEHARREAEALEAGLEAAHATEEVAERRARATEAAAIAIAAHETEIRDAAKASAAAHRELLNETGNAAKEFSTGYVSSIGEVIASWDALAEASRASGTTMLSTGRLMERGVTAIANNIAESVGGTMTSAFSSAVGAWLDGSKSFVEAAEEMAKGVIKALVQESIVQGVTELARGIADLASYRYDSAALHFAAAAAWAVVGGAAGAIGAATGAFGGGGKAEGASQREMADRDRERARDVPTGNAVINIYADGMPVTRADFAAGMSRALRDTVRAGYLPAGALGR